MNNQRAPITCGRSFNAYGFVGGHEGRTTQIDVLSGKNPCWEIPLPVLRRFL